MILHPKIYAALHGHMGGDAFMSTTSVPHDYRPPAVVGFNDNYDTFAMHLPRTDNYLVHQSFNGVLRRLDRMEATDMDHQVLVQVRQATTIQQLIGAVALLE